MLNKVYCNTSRVRVGLNKEKGKVVGCGKVGMVIDWLDRERGS